MNVTKMLTPYNHNKGTIDRIKYIVIHYVGATGSAKANCNYYAGGNRRASAHYYVDFNGDIYQSVEDKDIAWHCGAKSYVHPNCRNSNSIGIELCVRNNGSKAANSKDWYFEDATVTNGIALAKELMQKYNVPAECVIRHYDVTGKICPNPFVYNHTKHTWFDFKDALAQTTVIIPEKKSGWKEEDGGWRFYNGDTGECVRNNWRHDKEKDQWYWFDGNGMMITNKWYKYNGDWFFLGADGVMCKSQLVADNGKIYAVNKNGEMVTEPVKLTPGDDGALDYNGLAK